jgi:hypothetical protein
VVVQTRETGLDSTRAWWSIADIAILVGFVVVGREAHGGATLGYDIFRTATPFLVGLIAGWVAAGARRTPLAIRTGATTAAVTVVVGLAVRRLVFGDGIAVPFVVVTALVLLAGLVGWRLVVLTLRRRRER